MEFGRVSKGNFLIGGISLDSWLSLFFVCHDCSTFRVQQWCWPNGQAAIEQSNLMILIFSVIKSVFIKQSDKNTIELAKGIRGN